MKNKKIAIIFIVIVIILAILAGIYKIMTSYMFEIKDKSEVKIEEGNNKLINYLKSIENSQEKKEQVELYLEENKITEQEAKEILK